MNELTYYQNYIEEANRVLEDYLLADDLFWNLNLAAPFGSPSYPRLTLGNLLLFQCYVEALAEGSNHHQRKVRILKGETARLAKIWQSHYEKKLKHEIRSRLRQWGQSMKDLKNDTRGNAPHYEQDVRVRVLLELLLETLPDEDKQTQVAALDRRLKRYVDPGDFLWEAEVQAQFPKERFWYLWGTIED